MLLSGNLGGAEGLGQAQARTVAQRTLPSGVEKSREAAAGSDWAGPTARHDAPWVLRPKWLRHTVGQAGGDRGQVVIQVPAAFSPRYLIGGRQRLAFLLIGAMARSAKG